MGDVKDRGFASMDKERQREVAKMGGIAAHKKGVAHEWTSEEARLAGKKGGRNSRTKWAKENIKKLEELNERNR